MLLGSLKRRSGMISLCFLVNRTKISTENEGKYEQMSPLISGSEESLGHRSASTVLLVCGGLRSPEGHEQGSEFPGNQLCSGTVLFAENSILVGRPAAAIESQVLQN